ncbi:hypothetical protein [Pseudomonas extremaustralis]|uniref:hypothetical protein n=1 Tax=Pseudomonas extremaustralis TaxID=359110 RepID=UPI002AA0BAE8|nr:hypothetical protein [Pseudomonas extremaustralis]
MEYLPWILMALGLFMLFVVSRRRAPVSFQVKVSNQRIGADIRTPHNGASGENTKVLRGSSRISLPPEAHASSVWMPVVLSLLITGTALAVVLLPGYYGEAQQKWAFGVIGLILGYWFKK